MNSLARVCVALLVEASLCGCSKHTGTAGGAGSGSAAGSAVTHQPSGPPQIACEKAIPKSVIAKHLANAKTEWGDPFDNGEGSYITSCRFVDAAVQGRTIVRYKC